MPRLVAKVSINAMRRLLAFALLGLAGCQQTSVAERSRMSFEIVKHTVIANRPITQSFSSFPTQKTSASVAPATVTPAARAICNAMGMDEHSGDECNAMGILAASARQTSQKFWFEKTTGGLNSQTPQRCLGPVLTEYHGSIDAPTGMTYLCHAADRPDYITPEELARFQAVVNKLNATAEKTFAQHQATVEIKSMIGDFTR